MNHKGSYALLLFALFALGSAHAEPPIAAKPAFNPATPKLTPVKPLNAANGPGTQTEDDVYVGVKRQVQGVNTPGSTLQIKPNAGTSPNTTGKKNARDGGDDDLDDLEVERRKVEGITLPSMGAPQPRPGAGTSPNTGLNNGNKP